MAGKGKSGPPAIFQPDFVRRAREYAIAGLGEVQMARNFGVSKSAVSMWKQRYPEFREAIEQGAAMADADVTISFFRQATGWERHYKAKVKRKDATGAEVEIEEDRTTYYPPVTAATIRWLEKRRPEKWGATNDAEYALARKRLAEADTGDETTIQMKALEILERMATGKVQSAAAAG